MSQYQQTQGRSARLERVLHDLLGQAPEFQAAAVVSFDGLPMAGAMPPGFDEDRVAAMSAALLSLGERASQGLGRGELSQVYIEGENGTVFLVSADDEAVLVAVGARGAKVGLMLFEVRRAAQAVADALRIDADESPFVEPYVEQHVEQYVEQHVEQYAEPVAPVYAQPIVEQEPVVDQVAQTYVQPSAELYAEAVSEQPTEAYSEPFVEPYAQTYPETYPATPYDSQHPSVEEAVSALTAVDAFAAPQPSSMVGEPVQIAGADGWGFFSQPSAPPAEATEAPAPAVPSAWS